jgi:hypothetical protein
VTFEDARLAELRRQFPLWEVWFVRLALGGVTWCANPWAKKDDRRNVLHADTAEHLAEYIAEHTEDGLRAQGIRREENSQ